MLRHIILVQNKPSSNFRLIRKMFERKYNLSESMPSFYTIHFGEPRTKQKQRCFSHGIYVTNKCGVLLKKFRWNSGKYLWDIPENFLISRFLCPNIGNTFKTCQETSRSWSRKQNFFVVYLFCVEIWLMQSKQGFKFCSKFFGKEFLQGFPELSLV